jgi:hypothetical protein
MLGAMLLVFGSRLPRLLADLHVRVPASHSSYLHIYATAFIRWQEAMKSACIAADYIDPYTCVMHHSNLILVSPGKKYGMYLLPCMYDMSATATSSNAQHSTR